jgi:dipeptidyl aminopeptidase/acylaminoacyl peptidase
MSLRHAKPWSLLPCLCACAAASLAAAPPEPPAPRPVRYAEGLVTTQHDDAHVSLSPDGQTLYFLRDTPDFAHWTVLQAHRTREGRWSPPEVAPFSGRWSDADVAFTRDGRRLFFVSNRPLDGRGPARRDTELWVMERTGDRTGTGWSEPRHLPELGSPGDEWFPSLTDDGTLYFGSERPGGRGQCDLWRARWLGDHFAEPENLGAVINTPGQEIEAYVSPDERFLLFAAKGRPEGRGEYDLFVSYRCEGQWTPPQPLGADVNSEGWDFGARISPDGRSLYFTSNRSDFAPPRSRPLGYAELMRRLEAPGNGLRDVYRVDVSALGLRPPCAPPPPNPK